MILLYWLDENAIWPPSMCDTNPAAVGRLASLREHSRQHTYTPFQDPDDPANLHPVVDSFDEPRTGVITGCKKYQTCQLVPHNLKWKPWDTRLLPSLVVTHALQSAGTRGGDWLGGKRRRDRADPRCRRCESQSDDRVHCVRIAAQCDFDTGACLRAIGVTAGKAGA